MFESKIVLFLCSGNYYRSRFAELLFNHSTRQQRLGWRATSRGVAVELGVNNVGPISLYAFSGLSARGVSLDFGTLRPPLTLAQCDLMSADRIIALKRDEHLPIIMREFPQWASQIEFWRVRRGGEGLSDDQIKAAGSVRPRLLQEVNAKGGRQDETQDRFRKCPSA